jgi:NAD(P)-dependent dehydrogenase (short-subunit alcohol dehydrogenase family)
MNAQGSGARPQADDEGPREAMAADASMSTLPGSAQIRGGLGDISLALACALARAGADIAVCDLADSGQAAPPLHDIAAMGRRARDDRVDVGDERAVEAWVEACARELGAPTIERVPTGKLIASEEVAQAVAWLCDPHAAHCTGAVLTLDGGLSLLAGGA